MIAATVRTESASYPRPTSVETFQKGLIHLAQEIVKDAVAQMRTNPSMKISLTCASNGAGFLFSSRHLNCDQATAIAEWLAVGKFENP